MGKLKYKSQYQFQFGCSYFSSNELGDFIHYYIIHRLRIPTTTKINNIYTCANIIVGNYETILLIFYEDLCLHDIHGLNRL